MIDFKQRSRSRHRDHASHSRHAQTERPSRPIAATAIAGMDKILLYTTIALAVLGLTAVFSASAMEAMDKYGYSFYFALRQFIFLVLGFGIMYGVSKVPFFNWTRWTKWIAFGVIALLVYTLASGVEAYGAERWIRIFGVQFQPSELGKISVILLLAQALGHDPGRKNKLDFVVNTGLILVTLFLILKQPSLSMTIILSSVSAGLMFIGGIPAWMLGICGGAGGVFLVNKLMHTEYQMRRITGWLDPWKDAQDTGYNLIQSYYAIASGGLFGRGPGMSHQKLYYLPFQYTDFIFPVWAEEWGFIGSLIIIGLFLTLLYRGFEIARTCRSHFGQLLAMGVTMVLAAQIIINLAVATGVFPVTGVTLPLISYGGTSVVVTMVMIGILLNISRYRVTVSHISASHPA